MGDFPTVSTSASGLRATPAAKGSLPHRTGKEPDARRTPLPPSPGDSAACGERWDIWRAQIAAGQDPCFATAQRFLCQEAGCRWRARCLRLRAEWLR